MQAGAFVQKLHFCISIREFEGLKESRKSRFTKYSLFQKFLLFIPKGRSNIDKD